jgi:beta-N-acetylhexosaminidase
MSINLRPAERLSGSVLIAGFDGVALPDDLVRLIQENALGGAILFKRNIETLSQLSALLEEIHRAAPEERPPLIGVDQEGGRVVRLREPLTVLPPARRFGEIDDPELTRKAGALLGTELRAVGFTLDFAPVLDVDTNPESPVIGDRAFGSTPEAVKRHALAFAEGLSFGGVVPCAKHFPGHGDAALDSHLALPRVNHDTDRLRQLEMAPFAEWVRGRYGPVMTAHVLYPALDPDRPATLSRPVIEGELRQRLGFDGVVFSDDLEMGAIQALGGPGEAAVRAIEAGVDGLLVCRREDARAEMVEALSREVMRSSAFAEKLEAASRRLRAISFPEKREPFAWIGSTSHRELQNQLLTELDRHTQ